jgi:tRNA threonylcarbamoyladenosine biosynthesis protein TsaE
MKIITDSSEETKKLGKEFAKKVKGGDTVLLFGDLGAGKTTFVQGFAEGLGVKDRILSPTFVLFRQHQIPTPLIPLPEGEEKRNVLILNHIDLYRIVNPTEQENLGLGELFEDGSAITLIEWAERLKNFSPSKGYKINLRHLSENEREIEIIEIKS